eukprot:ctg_4253.g450
MGRIRCSSRAITGWPTAGADGVTQGVRAAQTAAGHAGGWLAAYDGADGGADRDAAGAGRGAALVLVQHLQHAGSRGGGGGEGGLGARVRVEGRVVAGLLAVHRSGADVAGRGGTASGRGRWRRYHAA